MTGDAENPNVPWLSSSAMAGDPVAPCSKWYPTAHPPLLLPRGLACPGCPAGLTSDMRPRRDCRDRCAGPGRPRLGVPAALRRGSRPTLPAFMVAEPPVLPEPVLATSSEAGPATMVANHSLVGWSAPFRGGMGQEQGGTGYGHAALTVMALRA